MSRYAQHRLPFAHRLESKGLKQEALPPDPITFIESSVQADDFPVFDQCLFAFVAFRQQARQFTRNAIRSRYVELSAGGSGIWV
jgi:hypothetical protein